MPFKIWRVEKDLGLSYYPELYFHLSEFLKLSGTPYNCADDITAYYEIEDCGEIDQLLRKSNIWLSARIVSQ